MPYSAGRAVFAFLDYTEKPLDADTHAYLAAIEARLAQAESAPVTLAYRHTLTSVKSVGGQLGQVRKRRLPAADLAQAEDDLRQAQAAYAAAKQLVECG